MLPNVNNRVGDVKWSGVKCLSNNYVQHWDKLTEEMTGYIMEKVTVSGIWFT